MDWLVIVGCYTSLSLALVGVKAKQSNSFTPNKTNNTNSTVNVSQIQSNSPAVAVSPSSVNMPPQPSRISPMKQSQISSTQQKMDKFIQNNLNATNNNTQQQSSLLPTPTNLPSNLI